MTCSLTILTTKILACLVRNYMTAFYYGSSLWHLPALQHKIIHKMLILGSSSKFAFFCKMTNTTFYNWASLCCYFYFIKVPSSLFIASQKIWVIYQAWSNIFKREVKMLALLHLFNFLLFFFFFFSILHNFTRFA